MRVKLALAAGLMFGSMAAWGAPGAGITGSAHDWSSAVTVDASGKQSGGTSTQAYYVVNSAGVRQVATPAQIAAGQFYNSFDPGTGTTNNWGVTTTGTAANKIVKVDAAGAPIPDGTNSSGFTPVSTRIQVGQCTKCHTPHQGKSGNLLWNHTLMSTTYSWDDTTTTAGTTYPTFKGDTYKGPTTKCLTCHDGTMSSTDGMWFGRTYLTGTAPTLASAATWSSHLVTKGGLPGGNLTGTHPVAMPYPLNGASNTYNGVANGAEINSTEWVADPKATNGIRLFHDDGTGKITAGTVAGRTGIECSSCHDVHNGAKVKDASLVTGTLTGSTRTPGGYICTQCHLK